MKQDRKAKHSCKICELMTNSWLSLNWLYRSARPPCKNLLIYILCKISAVTKQTFSQPNLSGGVLRTWVLAHQIHHARLSWASTIQHVSLIVHKSLGMKRSRYKLRVKTGPRISAGLCGSDFASRLWPRFLLARGISSPVSCCSARRRYRLLLFVGASIGTASSRILKLSHGRILGSSLRHCLLGLVKSHRWAEYKIRVCTCFRDQGNFKYHSSPCIFPGYWCSVEEIWAYKLILVLETGSLDLKALGRSTILQRMAQGKA